MSNFAYLAIRVALGASRQWYEKGPGIITTPSPCIHPRMWIYLERL
ncbi:MULTISPECIES: hypothetical protein [Rhizobiaceae]|nr:hypothetical protein [Sinorhizobium sp. RAC02]AOF88972.1 hypothetical protein BSY16_3916 [Sinorhizobium sp. RAC02]